MKKLVLALSLFLSATAYAGINQSCAQFTAAGAATYAAKPGDQEICHKNYAVIHSCAVKAPIAVFEHLTVQRPCQVQQHVKMTSVQIHR
jgi:hypothetical protein